MLSDEYGISDYMIEKVNIEPIAKTKFKKMKETGLEAELYFINNFNSLEVFNNGVLQDARLFGDGYDFQISVGFKSK